MSHVCGNGFGLLRQDNESSLSFWWRDNAAERSFPHRVRDFVHSCMPEDVSAALSSLRGALEQVAAGEPAKQLVETLAGNPLSLEPLDDGQVSTILRQMALQMSAGAAAVAARNHRADDLAEWLWQAAIQPGMLADHPRPIIDSAEAITADHAAWVERCLERFAAAEPNKDWLAVRLAVGHMLDRPPVPLQQKERIPILTVDLDSGASSSGEVGWLSLRLHKGRGQLLAEPLMLGWFDDDWQQALAESWSRWRDRFPNRSLVWEYLPPADVKNRRRLALRGRSLEAACDTALLLLAGNRPYDSSVAISAAVKQVGDQMRCEPVAGVFGRDGRLGPKLLAAISAPRLRLIVVAKDQLHRDQNVAADRKVIFDAAENSGIQIVECEDITQAAEHALEMSPGTVPEWFDHSRFCRWLRARGRPGIWWADTENRCRPLSGDEILEVAREADARATSFDDIRMFYADSPPLFIEESPDLSWSGITVPNCVLELPWTDLGGITTKSDKIHLLVENLNPPIQQVVPAALASVRDDWLREREATAARTRPLSNDPSYALVGLTPKRIRTDGDWRCSYVLRVRECKYYDFLWPNTCLDEPVLMSGKRTTLRDVFDLHTPRVSELDRVQVATPKLGAGVVVVTADRFVVVSVRSPDTAIAPGGYHLAVAEGMLSSDVGHPRRQAPFSVAVRGLQDELGLVADVDAEAPDRYDYRESDLRCLGLVLDTLRVQPMLFFYLNTSLTFSEVYSRWLEAKDRPENRNLIAAVWNRETAKQLIRGSIHGVVRRGASRSVELQVSSNHAQAGFALAARYKFG